jgi:Beta-galactosidase
MTLGVSSAGAASASIEAAPAATPSLLFGTLDSQMSTAAAEAKAGVSVAMFELDWASFEPKKGVYSASYLATMRCYLQAFQAAGMRVTLGLGLQDPPSWVFSLPDSRYVDQDGDVSSEANFVFSEAVRQAAVSYLTQVAADLPLANFWAIRLSSGGDAEMLYPPGGKYWAFGHSALTGVGLPPTMTPSPFPRWRPGQPGLTAAQTDRWVNWYVGGLDDVTDWQMRTLSGLGFTGYYQLVTPGSGTRPDVLSEEEQQELPDGTTGVGAVWDRYYAMLPDKTHAVAYVSSVADESGDDDTCLPGDNSLPLTSDQMDSWSATRWISRIAAENGLPVAGENVGYGMPASLDSHYTNTSSSGMMADAIRQAASCGFQVFYWAHDVHLWDGTIPFARYAGYIASVDAP